jgi:hypothetical protein
MPWDKSNLCSFEMISFVKRTQPVSTHFEQILYSTLQTEIGWSCVISLEDFVLLE